MARNPRKAESAIAAVVITLNVTVLPHIAVIGQSRTPNAGIAVFHITLIPEG